MPMILAFRRLRRRSTEISRAAWAIEIDPFSEERKENRNKPVRRWPTCVNPSAWKVWRQEDLQVQGHPCSHSLRPAWASMTPCLKGKQKSPNPYTHKAKTWGNVFPWNKLIMIFKKDTKNIGTNSGVSLTRFARCMLAYVYFTSTKLTFVQNKCMLYTLTFGSSHRKKKGGMSSKYKLSVRWSQGALTVLSNCLDFFFYNKHCIWKKKMRCRLVREAWESFQSCR